MARLAAKQIIGRFTNLSVSGTFDVTGSTVFIQSTSDPVITVLGSQIISSSYLAPGNGSGSLSIFGLGTFADTGSNSIVDAGDESF